MLKPPAAIIAWFDRHREKIADGGWLLLALNAPKLVLGLPRTPWLAQAAVLVVFGLLASPKAHLTPGLWQRYRQLLPGYIVTAVVSVIGFGFWFDLPRLHWWFAPLWLALTALTRFPLGSYHAGLKDWMRNGRLDVPCGDALILVFFSCCAPRWSQQSGPPPWAVTALILTWLWLHRSRGPSGQAPGLLPPSRRWAPLGLAATWGLLWLPAGPAAAIPAAVFAFWLALALLVYRAAVRRWAADPETGLDEVMRWLGLIVVVMLFFSPFFRAGVHGSGDAHYYATFLADALEQFRHGVFPVYVGQSEYQFNGSVIPIRIAPGFQYAGGLADLLTLRTLNPMAVQNILVCLTALGTSFTTYGCTQGLGLRGARAWLLAVLFLTCPGVMGLALNENLYMSWLTVPWVTVALTIGLRSYSAAGAGLYAALGFSAGLTWWMHPPIALWLTLLLSLLQLARFLRPVSSWRVLAAEAAAGAASFLSTAAYPLVSAGLNPADPALGAGGGFVVPASHVLQQLLDTFPGAWLPMTDIGRLLVDYQLGYGLLALGLAAVPAAWRSGRRELRALVVLAGLLLLLLVPIPWLNLTLWKLIPDAIRTVTNKWVMQRLYLLLAAIVVALLALAWNARHVIRRPALTRIALLVACLWSLSEALKFVHGSWATYTATGASPARLAPENITLTRFSYGLFSRKPAYFTHGATDPVLENRLLADDLQTVVDGNYSSAIRLAGSPAVIPFAVVEGHVASRSPLVLFPGKRYLLRLSAGSLTPTGNLVLEGRRFQRVYALPEYGEALSFGLGGDHTPFLPLHTTGSIPKEIRLLFESSVPVDLAALAEGMALRLSEYPPSALPVQIQSWMPYRARVTSGVPAWLETPRMFQAGYVATLDGRPAGVKRSAEGLASVHVPAGTCVVELRYVPPAGMQGAFWVSLGAICTGLIAFLLAGWRVLVDCPPPR